MRLVHLRNLKFTSGLVEFIVALVRIAHFQSCRTSPNYLTGEVQFDIFSRHWSFRRRRQVAKAADCKSATVGSTPTDASRPIDPNALVFGFFIGLRIVGQFIVAITLRVMKAVQPDGSA